MANGGRASTRAQVISRKDQVNGLLVANKKYSFICGGKHMTIVSPFSKT